MTPIPARAMFELVRQRGLELEPSLDDRLLPAWVRSIPPVVQDILLAVVLAATLLRDLANQTVLPGGPMRSADALGYVLVALLVLPLALRRRYPVTVFAAILVDAVIVTTLFYRPSSFGFGLIVATYTVARWCKPQTSLAAFVLAQVFAVFIKVRVEAAGVDVGWFGWPMDATYMGAAWFLGTSIRSRQHYLAALEQSRERLAERAVQDERARIARELHDAVGHSISVMTLHVGAAQELLDKQPSRAKEALSSAGDVGRSVLEEMDQLLGLLRAEDTEPNPILQPSLINLDTLVEEFRDLGLAIKTNVDGDPVPLPTAVDQSAFRIIQEALTNTLKHAGPTDTEINLTFSDSDLALEIRDHGHSTRRHEAPEGHRSQGIIGMRERTTMLEGDLEVGQCDDNGFRVAARLPLSSTRRP